MLKEYLKSILDSLQISRSLGSFGSLLNWKAELSLETNCSINKTNPWDPARSCRGISLWNGQSTGQEKPIWGYFVRISHSSFLKKQGEIEVAQAETGNGFFRGEIKILSSSSALRPVWRPRITWLRCPALCCNPQRGLENWDEHSKMAKNEW